MKDTFVLTTKYIRQIERLTMEQRGVLFTAVMQYEAGEELPEMDGMTGMAFDWIRADLDDNRKKYDEQCKKNADNARKRPVATASDRKRPVATASDRKRPVATASETERNALDNDYEYESDNDYEIDNDKERVTREKSRRFSPPSLSEVKEYCQERVREGKPAVNPEAFIAYYEANGWKVGKNSMKDWKAAVRNWEQREKERAPAREPPKKAYQTSDRQRTKDEWSDLEARILNNGGRYA